jgi:hypothetical protein
VRRAVSVAIGVALVLSSGCALVAGTNTNYRYQSPNPSTGGSNAGGTGAGARGGVGGASSGGASVGGSAGSPATGGSSSGTGGASGSGGTGSGGCGPTSCQGLCTSPKSSDAEALGVGVVCVRREPHADHTRVSPDAVSVFGSGLWKVRGDPCVG